MISVTMWLYSWHMSKDIKSIFIFLLSQSNNNHKPNNKTTITVIELRQSNRWEYPPPPPPTTNSKLHDRAAIEQNSENKSHKSKWEDLKTVFEPYPNPNNSLLGHQKVKNNPKFKSKSNIRIERNIENESFSTA